MFYLVFSTEDKEKMLSNGAIFISEQKVGDTIAYLFNIDSFKFDIKDLNDIKYVKTNNLIL